MAFPKETYNLKAVTLILMCIIVGCYFLQLLIYYIFYNSNGYSWGCLLLNLGASELSKEVNCFQYHRLFTPLLLHNSFGHLLSNSISLLFVGFYIEFQIQNKLYYILLYVISGVIGNLTSLLFENNNVSVGASGAIIGLCGYFVTFFILNFDKMGPNQKFCYGIFFLIIFLNLFSGVSEGGNNVDMFSHIGGFLGGLACSMIIIYKSRVEYRFNQNVMKYLYYSSVTFVIGMPILTLIIINTKSVPDNTKYICSVHGNKLVFP